MRFKPTNRINKKENPPDLNDLFKEGEKPPEKQEIPTPTPELNKDRDLLAKSEVPLSDLPSKGVTYPPGSKVYFIPFLWVEVKKFSGENRLLPLHKKYELLLEGIFCDGFSKLDLTVQDFLFLALMRKLGSFGVQKFSVSVECPHCNFPNSYYLGLNDIEVDDLRVSGDELPAYGRIFEDMELAFMPLTIGKYFKLAEKDLLENEYACLLYQCVNHDPDDLIENYLPKINSADGGVLETIDTYFGHGIAPKTVKCTNPGVEILEDDKDAEKGQQEACEKTFTFSLEGGDSLFFPSGSSLHYVSSRIRLGDAPTPRHI
jgi:hypothetical protein